MNGLSEKEVCDGRTVDLVLRLTSDPDGADTAAPRGRDARAGGLITNNGAVRAAFVAGLLLGLAIGAEALFLAACYWLH